MKKRIRSERDLYNWLFEAEENYLSKVNKDLQKPDALTAEKIQKLWALPYEAFVAELKNVAKDDKFHAFLAAGKIDGSPDDEGIKVAPMTIAGKELVPTQSEIDLSNSVAYSFKNPPSIAGFYKGGAWKGGDPIIIAGGKYVIDGHHRWSSATVFNPEIILDCINIDIADPEMALKMTQAAIAATQKNVPTQAVKKGMNIYNMSFSDIVNKFASDLYMGKAVLDQLTGKLEITATPEEVATAKTVANRIAEFESGPGEGGENLDRGGMQFGGDTEGAMGGAFLREAKVGETVAAGLDPYTAYKEKWGEAAASLAHNAKSLAPAGKFPRPIMPQTGKGDGGPGPAGLKAVLQSGDINSKSGFDVSGGGGAEVQKESLYENRIRRIHLPGIHRSRS